MHVRRVLAAAMAAPVLAALVAPAPLSAAVSSADAATVAKAAAWVDTKQQPDGSFEVAGFPGFETPQAVTSLAAAAMPAGPWSAKRALDALQVVTNAKGLTALDSLDDLAEGTGDKAVSPGLAAKLITLAAGPLCLSPTDFDPQDDGGVDLVARMVSARTDNGAYAPDSQFSSTLYVALAFATIGRPVPADTIAYIRSKQQADGSWTYNTMPSSFGTDIDTTATAIQALIGAGVAANDPDVKQALDLLASEQATDGSWGFGDPNSTAVASLALLAAGRAPTHDADAFLRSLQAPDGHIAGPYDGDDPNTYATTQTIQALTERPLPIVPAAGSCAADGYLLFRANGAVDFFGTTPYGQTPTVFNAPIVGAAMSPSGLGYYRFASDGGVLTAGDASFHGSLGNLKLNQPIVTGAATPSGKGYVLFAGDGGVFTFGDAPFLGSLGNLKLNKPIVAATVTPSGKGYVLFASDGGVFTFGDARFLGSLGNLTLNKPIVAGSATPTGLGYVLFASDGGVFTFGDGSFEGSLGATPLNQPIVGGSLSPLGSGYALFAGDGGVFTFGDTAFAGSAAASGNRSPVVAGAID